MWCESFGGLEGVVVRKCFSRWKTGLFCGQKRQRELGRDRCPHIKWAEGGGPASVAKDRPRVRNTGPGDTALGPHSGRSGGVWMAW